MYNSQFGQTDLKLQSRARTNSDIASSSVQIDIEERKKNETLSQDNEVNELPKKKGKDSSSDGTD